jgi:microcystin degradation protein MlrC
VRIAIGQLWQETNTFNPLATTRADFEQFGVLRGADLVERMADTNELGGFLQSLRQWPERPEVVGLVRLPAWPAGVIDQETGGWLVAELTAALRACLPVDGVLLALHGSMSAAGMPDVEGEVLGAVRGIVGPDIPVVATLDLHANVTAPMVDAADALVLYHTAPHLDVFETGQRAAGALRRLLVDRVKPVTAFQKIPMVVPAERANTQDPRSVSYALRHMLVGLEARHDILSAGLATVQPWLDVPELGTAVLVVSDGDAELATAECSRVAAEVWRRRREYLPELIPVAEAVRQAHQTPTGLVVLGDGADATTSGAPGDSTAILRELLQYDWPRPALITLVSPEVVDRARQKGAGAEWTARLGGVRDSRFSKPLEVRVRVARLFEARFVMSGHLARNMGIDMGPAAVLQRGNVFVVATTRPGPQFAPDLFRAAGFDPARASVLVAKSPCGFRAAYEDMAFRILMVQSPGCAPSDFWRYEYRRIPRPLWPWDEIPWWRPRPMALERHAGVGRRG